MKKMYKLFTMMTVFLTVFGFVGTSAYADLTWTCTQYKQGRSTTSLNTENINSSNERRFDTDTIGVCYTANITGSISAQISQADKDYITNTILNSTILSNIQTQATNASTNALAAKTAVDNLVTAVQYFPTGTTPPGTNITGNIYNNQGLKYLAVFYSLPTTVGNLNIQ